MSPAKIEIKEISHGSREYEQEIELRNRILREPLGLKLSQADLDCENADIHLGAFAGEKLIGCLMLSSVDSEKIKMRQVAVDTSAQGTGIGRKLVEASEAKARKLGFSLIELNAREYAVPFYLKLGYEVIGDQFIEVTIPHFKMRKEL